ncbi:helix-turn-helix transcriptional regulator [Niabella drilacis]|uniref:AraC-type DNA-binding protein n=1 Tax=Niabella drilacis (strain DSM 25811 / CCM 8410 / CCUG 62505 / LMG 26954 / E90) TaxID=1285928 RepID=A0A1G7A9J2_NIADE|nr:AraC family transcriptional regulator [Niabella drilacis]SDE10556.1 AraC-type DNA-binding protein [Niabella drilacis]
MREKETHQKFAGHPDFEITLIENCRGKRFVGAHTEIFNDTELVLLSGHLPHSWQFYKTIGPETQAHATTVHFAPDFLGKDFLEKPEARLLTGLFTNAARGIRFYGKTIADAKALLLAMVFEEELARLGLLLQLLEVLALSGSYNLLNPAGFNILKKAGEVEIMNRVLTYIRHHFRQPVSLQEIADLVPMSAPAFCRFFKAKTGKTVTGMVKELRISYAARLLLEGRLNVSETCYQCGYSSLSNFTIHFRELRGMTPQEFLERYFVAACAPGILV